MNIWQILAIIFFVLFLGSLFSKKKTDCACDKTAVSTATTKTTT